MNVLLINLLVAVLNDAFTNFQAINVIVDYKEKAEQVFEIERALLFFRSVPKSENLCYLHACNSPATKDDNFNLKPNANIPEKQENDNNQEIIKKVEIIETKIELLDAKLDAIFEKLK